jgi:hypothetical protein
LVGQLAQDEETTWTADAFFRRNSCQYFWVWLG